MTSAPADMSLHTGASAADMAPGASGGAAAGMCCDTATRDPPSRSRPERLSEADKAALQAASRDCAVYGSSAIMVTPDGDVRHIPLASMQPSMSPIELRRAMGRLRLNPVSLAWHLGTTAQRVRRWRYGVEPVPVKHAAIIEGWLACVRPVDRGQSP